MGVERGAPLRLPRGVSWAPACHCQEGGRVVIETVPSAQVFHLRAPLLSAGRSNIELARTDLMWLRLKVYAEGGENAPHHHVNEDHSFIVLEGQATFHDGADNTRVLNRYDGILLPKGTDYWFQSTGDTNLVLIRVGASRTPNTGDDRTDPQGRPLLGDSIENKHVDGVPIPGKFFGH